MKTGIMLRRIMYAGTGILDEKILKRTTPLFVLCYHGISNKDWLFDVKKNVFEKHMDYLLENYQPITVKQLDDHIYGRKIITAASFLLTFDDGYRNILEVVDFCLEKKIAPTVFVMSNRNGVNRNELGTNSKLLTVKDYRDLTMSGWSIGCHSATHPDFERPDKINVQTEIISAKDGLARQIEGDVDYFAYPKGGYNQKIIRAVKGGYKLAFSMDDGMIKTGINPYLVPRIGINRSHTFSEFKSIFSPSSIFVRGFLKKTPLKYLI